MKRVKFTLGLMLSFLLMGASVSVNAQSAGLSATLIAMGVTDDGDGVITPAEFSAWMTATPPTSLTIPAATAPNLTNDSISELVGLFPNVTSINVSACTNPGFTTLDVSGATHLEELDCHGVGLTSLNVTGCTALNMLFCYNNELTSLDVTGCTALELLDCSSNKLTSLDVSGYTSLISLNCSDNKLTSLNVAGCTALTTLMFNNNNELTSLDVSGTALTSLTCNNLTSLKVKGCSALITLDCQSSSDKKLTSLDLTGCKSLTTLDCSGNKISSIDISNTAIGNLTDISTPTNFSHFEQTGTDISIVNNKQTTVMTTVPDYIKEITNGKYYNITYKTNINVDAYLIKKAIPGYIVKVADDDVPGYELQSLKVTKSDGSAVTVTNNKFDMPASDVTVECVYVPKANAKKFTIDWAIIDVDNDNQIVSSKGNEVDGFAIIVPGSAVEGSEITFSIRSNYTYKIDAITVEALYSGYGDSDEFHAVSFTDLNDGGVSDGSDKTGGSYKFRMPISNVKITLRVNDSSKPGLPTLPNPIIRHGVQIISNGLQTSPGAANGSNGYHYVAGNQNFTFTVYSANPINVKTSRGHDEDGVIIEDNGDASWKVTIRRVSTNLVVTVTEVTTESGTGENGTTGNEAIAKDAVWAANGTLYVKTATPGTMSIYSVTGQLCKQAAVSGDATFTLSKGIYIVQLNGKAYKVVL